MGPIGQWAHLASARGRAKAFLLPVGKSGTFIPRCPVYDRGNLLTEAYLCDWSVR